MQVGQYKPKSRGIKFYRIREGSNNVNGEIGNLLNSLSTRGCYRKPGQQDFVNSLDQVSTHQLLT